MQTKAERMRTGFLSLAVAGGVIAAGAARGATFTWIGGDAGSGNWSSSSNWDAGSVPASATTNDLIFSGNANGYVSSKNLAANPFIVKSLTFGAGLPAAFTVQGAYAFSFPANGLITQNSANKVTLDAPVRYTGSSAYIYVGGGGGGDVEIAGAYSFLDQSYLTLNADLTGHVILNQINLGGRTSIIYNKIPVSSGKEFRINGNIVFTTVGGSMPIQDVGRTVINGQFMHNSGIPGGVTLQPTSPGSIVLNNPSGNFVGGLADVTLAGTGFINLGGFTHTVRDAIYSSPTAVSNGTFAVRNFYLDYGTVKIPIIDAPGCQGNLVKRIITNNDSWIETPMNHSGVTRTLASDITFQGSNGTATNSAVEIDMAPQNGENARIILNNGGVGNNNNNRLSDTKPVTLGAGHLVLLGNASVPTTEQIGDVTFSRYSQLHVDALAGGAAVLAGLSLTRADFGTLYVTGDSLGSAAAANVSQITFATTPVLTPGTFGTVDAPLVPWAALGDADNYAQAATYGANGFRALTSSEYTNNVLIAGANVFITASKALDGSDRTIKSLTMRPPGNGTYVLSGVANEKLTITDGVIVSSKSNQTPYNHITVPSLTFGPNPVTGYEGIIHSFSGQTLTIDSAIADNAGHAVSLTKSGPHNLTLRGMNAIGGMLRVHEGVVSIQDNPNTASATETTTVRDLILSAGLNAGVDIGAGGRLVTTGTGTVVRIYRKLGGAALTGTGTLELSGGLWAEAALGGPTHTLTPAIALGAAMRIFDIPDGAPATDVAIDGAVSGSGGLVKVGAGNLELRGASTYSGPTVVSNGLLTVRNAGGSLASSPTLAVLPGAALAVDNSNGNNNDRLGDTQSLGLRSAEFRFAGNASAATAETVGSIDLAEGLNVMTLDALAGGASVLTATALNRSAATTLLLRGDNLGAAAAANVAQFRLGSAPTLVGGGSLGTSSAPVMPFIFGDTNIVATGSREMGSLVTYDANGFRLLSRSTEMTTTYAAGVNASGGGTISSDLAINSLFVQHSATVAGAAGRTLTITSGMIMHASGYDALNITVPYLTFGPNPVTGCEGMVYINRVGDVTSTIGSVITDNGASAVALTKSGNGRLVLSGANTYSGATTINAGILRLGTSNDRLPIGTALKIDAAGSFDLYGLSQRVAGLAGRGTVMNTAAGFGTLTVNAATDQIFHGAISGAVNLTKVGGAALTLSGGTINATGRFSVENGVLAIDNAGATARAGVADVAGGATLRLAGTSRFTVTNAVFAAGATLRVTLAGAAPDACSLLTATGTADFQSGAHLAVDGAAGFEPAKGGYWIIAEAPAFATLPTVDKNYALSVESGAPSRLKLAYAPIAAGTLLMLR